MAAQIAIRLLMENPYATPQELPIKFLVLINSAVPPFIMPLDGEEVTDISIDESPKLQMLFDIFKANPADHLESARPATLANGRQVRFKKMTAPTLGYVQGVQCADLQYLGSRKQNALHDVLRRGV